MSLDLLPTIVMSVNVFFTVLRIVANVPQLLKIVRDPCGASAISVGSWVVFAMANGSNGIYALVIASDPTMCAVNLVSACSCGTIAIVAAIRQRQARALRDGFIARSASSAARRPGLRLAMR